MLTIPAFLLMGCAASTKLDRPGLNVQADSSFTSRCRLPAKLPERALTQRQVEEYWANDRANLIRCGVSKQKLVDFMKKRSK